MSLFRKTKNYFSLNILPYKVQILLLDSAGKKVVKADEVIWEKDIIENGKVTNPDKLKVIIEKLITKNKIRQKSVVIGLPETKVFTKSLDMPKMKADEIDEAVRWQAKSFLPEPIEESYLDWRIINTPKKLRTIVLIVAVPKQIIDTYISVLKKLDLKPLCIETTTVSLARLVPDQTKLNIISEVQPKDAIITLCSGIQIKASSVISLSGEENGIGQKYFLQTIKKMTKFYEKRFDDTVNQIYLCGESVNKELKQKAEKELEKQVDFCPIKVKNLEFKQANNYAVAISLSRRKIATPEDENTINLLPPQIQQKYFEHKRNLSLYWSLLWLTFILGITSSCFTAFFVYNRQRLSKLNQQKLAQSKQFSVTRKQAEQINKINRTSKQVLSLAKRRQFPQETLIKIVKLLPEQVTLTDIDFDLQNQTVNLSGLAVERKDLLTFKKNIQSQPEFESVIVPISSLEKEKNLSFALGFKLTSQDEKK